MTSLNDFKLKWTFPGAIFRVGKVHLTERLPETLAEIAFPYVQHGPQPSPCRAVRTILRAHEVSIISFIFFFLPTPVWRFASFTYPTFLSGIADKDFEAIRPNDFNKILPRVRNWVCRREPDEPEKWKLTSSLIPRTRLPPSWLFDLISVWYFY